MDGAVVLVLLMPGAIIQLTSTAFPAGGCFLWCLRFCNTRNVSIIVYAEQERKKDKSSQVTDSHSVTLGAGTAQWLERWIHDWKTVGSNPCRSSGKIFFSKVNFLCCLLFWYPFHPRVTTVTCKRPRSCCQKCRWQVTAKYACTLHIWLCMKWHGAWLYGVHRTHWDGSSFMWHQQCQCWKYIISVDIQKHAIKSYSLV